MHVREFACERGRLARPLGELRRPHPDDAGYAVEDDCSFMLRNAAFDTGDAVNATSARSWWWR